MLLHECRQLTQKTCRDTTGTPWTQTYDEDARSASWPEEQLPAEHENLKGSKSNCNKKKLGRPRRNRVRSPNVFALALLFAKTTLNK